MGRHLTFWTVVFVVAAAALGLILVWLGASNAPTKVDDVWFEIAKAGVQLAVIAVIGGVVAWVLRYVDALREDDRRRKEHRLNVLRDVVVAYNGVKAARRILRAFGFDQTTDGQLTDRRVTEFVAQMRSINDAQLALEGTKRQVRADHRSFHQSEDLLALLECAERYVNHVVDDWEAYGSRIVSGADAAPLEYMVHLKDFLGESAIFRAGLANPMDRIQEIVRTSLLPGTGAKHVDVVETIASCMAIVDRKNDGGSPAPNEGAPSPTLAPHKA